jgi:hypothetical protein
MATNQVFYYHQNNHRKTDGGIMKKLLFMLFIMMALGSLFATNLLTDDFTGTPGTLLTAPANGWAAHSSAGSTPMTIGSSGLTYPNHSGSGVGYATSVSATGEDVNKTITTTTAGSIYYSFLLNTAISTPTAGYITHFNQAATVFYGRFWIANNGSGGAKFGLSKSSNTPTYIGGGTPTVYSLNTTYLIVVKYTFNTGSTTDDAVSVWVDPTLGGTETAPTLTLTDATTNDATSLIAFSLRQYNVGQAVIYDGVRVGTAWEDVTASGATVTAPTVTTAAITSIGITSASGGGEVTVTGGADVTEKGVVWNQTGTPVIDTDIHTSDGSGIGAFTSSLSPLTAITTYHVRAYATNSAGTGYGSEVDFTTMATEPTAQPTLIQITNPTTVSLDVAYTAASPIADGYIAIRKDVSASTTDPVDGTSYSIGNALGDGIVAYVGSGVSFTDSPLSSNTAYFYKIYSFNGSGTATNYFVTGPLTGNSSTISGLTPPTVTTATPITAITDITATGGGEVTADGGGALTERGVCWGTALNPTITADSHSSDGTAVGIFSSSLTSLTANTLYHVRAYASNADWTGYGSDVTFTTLKTEPAAYPTSFAAGTPTITTIPLTWVDAVSAEFYLIKGSTVSYDAITAPVDGVAETNAALVRNVAQVAQTYTFTGLTPSTIYYFKIFPYTSNTTGINYKTDGDIPVVTTVTAAYTPAFLFEENFVYAAASLLTSNGWTAHSGGGTNAHIVSATNLSTYPSYPSNGGFSDSLRTSGEDVSRTFALQTYGDVFCSFLIKVNSAQAAGDYLFHMGPNPIGSDFKAKVYVKLASAGYFYFGIVKQLATGVTVQYDTTPYAFGTTNLVVLKYSIVPGATNDPCGMWINPTIGASPPSSFTVTATLADTDVTGGIGAVALRQGSATNSAAALVDGIRVANTWALLFPGYEPGINTTGSLNSFNAVIENPSEPQQYTVSGTLLTSAIRVTAPTGFELSLTGTTTEYSSFVDVPQTGGVASSTVWVRLAAGTTAVSYAPANITHISEGATTVNKSVNGIVYSGEIIVTGAPTPFTGGVVGYETASKSYSIVRSGFVDLLNLTVTGPYKIRDQAQSMLYSTSLELGIGTPNFSIDVIYAPTSAGTNQPGTITHVAGDNQPLQAANVIVNLSGTAIDPTPVLTALPTTMVFAAKSGFESIAQASTITSAYLSVPTEITYSGEYKFCTTETGEYTNSPPPLAVDYNGPIYIKFAPTSQGTFNNTITFTSGTNIATINTTSYGLDPAGTYAPDLFISEYLEGASYDKGLEIYNGTGHPVNLSAYRLAQYNNGSSSVGSFTLVLGDINLSNGSCYTVVNSQSTNAPLLALASLVSTSSALSFNGDDAIALQKTSDGTNWTQVDIFGRIGDRPNPPGYWTAEVGYKTQDETLVRKASVYNGITVSPTGTGPTAFTTLGIEWDWYSIGTISNFGIHTFAPGSTPAAAPTILPAAGIKTEPVTVSITTTPGAQIWYTINGTDPTDASPSILYTVEFGVSSTTTVKARTYATGYAPSSVASALYIYPIPVSNIAALRGQTADNTTYYKLTGEAVLTLKSPAFANTKYIQDATGAILIYDAVPSKITTSYNLRDGITGIVGQLQLYNGMLELIPAADPGLATSTGLTITPHVISLSQLSSHQAELVQLVNVSFLSTGTFTLATNYNVQDWSGTGLLRAQYSDLEPNYIGTAVPLTPKTMVGVVLQRTLTETVFVPRSLDDFVAPAPPDQPINVVVNVVGNNVVLSWTNDPTVSSWKVWYSDESPTGLYVERGSFPPASGATYSCTLTGDALNSSTSKRFYYVVASR